MSVILSVGKWGGVYIKMGGAIRFTFGWFALTVIRPEFDVFVKRIIRATAAQALGIVR